MTQSSASRPSVSAAFFLVGPTASGKSAVAQHLAERDGLEILSADSMLIYRGMDIGTAKPGRAEQARVRHYGMDLAEPGETFSVGRYLEEASGAFRDGRCPIVCGGTGLYIKCLTEGLATRPPPDPQRRAALEARYQEHGVPGLRGELERIAPGRLARLADPNNPRRLIRAIELALSGAPDARTWPGASASPLVGLRRAPEDLRARIQARARALFAGGLLEEVAALRKSSPGFSQTARHAIGYAEADAVLEKRCSIEEAVARTAQRTWQLSRRQMTWFRHQARVEWVETAPGTPLEILAEHVQAIWRTHGPTPVILPT